MLIERNKINGAWTISDIINGQLVTRQYYGYTKREAQKIFKSDALKLEENEK